MSHGRGVYDIRFAAIDHALEPVIQSEEGLLSAKHAAKCIKEHDDFILKQAKEKHDKQNEKRLKKGKAAEPFHLRSKDGAKLTILPPIVHNLKINKSPTRKVFTFKGIQSSKGVTHLRETGLVYNNVYPDVERSSGLIIPKTLIKTENRPKKQLKTSRHKRKRIESLDDAEKKLRKLKRVKTQREEWGEIEEKGEVVKAWQPKKPRKSKKKQPPPAPKRPSKKKPTPRRSKRKVKGKN